MNYIWWALYGLSAATLLLSGWHAFWLLAWRRARASEYLSSLEQARERSPLGIEVFPDVLVQLPVFNEARVVERAIAAAGALDWPRARLVLQVLDDSTDETCELVDACVARESARGVVVEVLRREDRQGFKAGALAAGLERSHAEFVAIFDADFMPAPDFLKRLIPLFELDARVACVQARWGHLNSDANWLTRAQAVGVDVHFLVQQLARAAGALVLNFNGTAGIWRRSSIDAAGGWSGDTLTEDLDLSYRAQIRGDRIVLDPTTVVPAELPPTLGALKSQQQRWACGSTHCARRLVGAVWRSGMPLAARLEATFHLCGYFVCVAVVMMTWLVPLGIGHIELLMEDGRVWPLSTALALTALGPFVLTLAAMRASGDSRGWVARTRDAAALSCLGIGLAWNNSIGVCRGILRPIPTFVRTPKAGDGRSHRGPVPRLEICAAILSAVGLAALGARSPWTVPAYAVFCAAGPWALCLHWWSNERRAIE